MRSATTSSFTCCFDVDREGLPDCWAGLLPACPGGFPPDGAVLLPIPPAGGVECVILPKPCPLPWSLPGAVMLPNPPGGGDMVPLPWSLSGAVMLPNPPGGGDMVPLPWSLPGAVMLPNPPDGGDMVPLPWLLPDPPVDGARPDPVLPVPALPEPPGALVFPPFPDGDACIWPICLPPDPPGPWNVPAPDSCACAMGTSSTAAHTSTAMTVIEFPICFILSILASDNCCAGCRDTTHLMESIYCTHKSRDIYAGQFR